MSCQWNPSISVGLKELDDEHRELFSWLDMLERAMRNRDRLEIERVFEFLACFVVVHFDVEEILMVETTYPNQRRHRATHDRLVAEFLQLKSHYETTGAVSPAAFRSSGWVEALKFHLTEEDRAMARHVAQQRRGRDPLAAVTSGAAVPACLESPAMAAIGSRGHAGSGESLQQAPPIGS